MNKYLTSLLVVFVMIFTQAFACNKAATIQKLEDIADELRLHNKNIAEVTNDAHSSGKISGPFHLKVLTANSVMRKSLNTADKAIKAAKLVSTQEEMKSALDYARRIMDVEVFTAFQGIVESVIDIPADIKEKIDTILASIRLLFATVTSLFANAQVAIGGQENYGN